MDSTQHPWTALLVQCSALQAAAIFCSVGFLYCLFVREATMLRRVPGPFLASISKLWIVHKQLGLQRPLVDLALHEKYGPVVRVAPNEVIISSPQAKKPIYGAMSKFSKGDWYCATGDYGWSGSDRLDFLPELLMEKYRSQRRLIGGAYTSTYMKEIEPHLNVVLERNLAAMRQQAGESVNADTYFSYFSSDCIQAATFGKCRGYVEHNTEDGAIAWVHEFWHYMHWVGYFPMIHRVRLWYMNVIEEPVLEPLTAWWSKVKLSIWEVDTKVEAEGKVFNQSIFGWAKGELQARFEAKHCFLKPTTIADRLLQIQMERPALKDGWIKDACLQNFNAGVETIGITLSVFIDFVIAHPGCQRRIQREIDEARAAGSLSSTPKLKEIESLPYLSACLSESRRLHPPLAHPLARKVPQGGCQLDGYSIPAGTTVGMNPWVLGRDKSLYGEDANVWRPERWLEYPPEHLKVLDAHSMFFGDGLRSCPGQYLAEAIFTKVIPILFMNFEFKHTAPDEPRRIRSTFMTRLEGVMVQWKSRGEAKS